MSSVEDFAEQLFRKSPGAANSINLDIDVNTPSELFEVLLLIVTYGMKRWYGPRIDISQISAHHLERLQEYFLSFGITLHIDKTVEPDVYMIDNKAYMEKTALEQMSFTVATNGFLWIIRFSFAVGTVPRWS